MPQLSKNPLIVSPGEYEVSVVAAKQQRSQSGNEMIVLTLTIGRWGRFVTERLVFTEPCYWKIAEFLIAMGEEFVANKEIRAEDYKGRSARALVGVYEYHGRQRNKIDRWLPPKASPVIEPASVKPTSEEAN